MKQLKNLWLSFPVVGALMFTGCGASNGLGIGGMGQTEVKKVFDIGTIESSQKVLISKDLMATVTGAGAGAVAGAMLGSRSSGANAVKGGLIGAGVGAGLGYVGGMMMNNNEQEAYEIIIRGNKGQTSKAYLEKELPIGTTLEYVVREDGKITNIDVKNIKK